MDVRWTLKQRCVWTGKILRRCRSYEILYVTIWFSYRWISDDIILFTFWLWGLPRLPLAQFVQCSQIWIRAIKSIEKIWAGRSHKMLTNRENRNPSTFYTRMSKNPAFPYKKATPSNIMNMHYQYRSDFSLIPV